MTKKYLSVEEAAQMLGLDPGEVLRYREQDKIRGFADRGTWKFKTEDVENFKRTLNSDSPTGDFPMLDDDSDNVLMDDDDLLADQPTIIRRGRPDDASSDSDVRLIFDGSPGSDMLPDSDSDVRLAGGSGSLLDSSDSDVKLVGGDETASHDASMSDVRLAAKRSSGEIRMSDRPMSDSDSDVKLVGKSKSSAEMSFPGLDSKPGQDETIDLAPDNESVLEEDSGISLVGDSGISLERPDDSGISLTSDSALSLTSDSGISLDITSDSGISLDLASSDIKGGRGKPAPKKPVKPQKPVSKKRTDSDLELGGTMPEMDIPLAGGSDDLIDTNVEVPLMDDDSHDSSYDLADSAGDTTSVITLDDDSQDDDSASVDVIDSESFDEFSEEDDESVEVAGEIGEDDEIEEDVFGADDEDFDDSFTAGESQGELEFPTRGAPVAVEQEWGVGTFIGLALTSLCMVACGMVAYDLVLSMWQADVNGMNPATTMIGNMLFP